MTVLHLDVETYSTADLKKVGVENYVRANGFCVTAIAWAFDKELVRSVVWPGTGKLPEVIEDHIDGGGIIKAWNANFEWNVLDKHYGVVVEREQMDCVMQRSYAFGLPGGLFDAGAALGLPAAHLKDKTARRLMLEMSKPRRDGSAWHYDPAERAKLLALGDYCRQDVEAERALDEAIPALAPFERKLSLLDARINEHGIMIDRAAVKALLKAFAYERNKVNAECAKLTGGAVDSPGTTGARLIEWLKAQGVEVDSVDKATVAEALKRASPAQEPSELNRSSVSENANEINGPVRRVLELRQLAAKSSLGKLMRMSDVASVVDDRARNNLQFYGAGRTGRWAGRGIQVQNLPKPVRGLDPLRTIAVVEKDPKALGMFTSTPMAALSGAIRGCIVASPGKVLVSIDLSQIEARVNAWLSRQDDVVSAFRDGRDIYVEQAKKVGSDNRQLGKVLVLACGFQMGAEKFRDTAEMQYGVMLTMSEATSALAAWRAGNARIVGFWKEMENMVKEAVRLPGAVISLGRHNIAAQMKGGVMRVRKPNGVSLVYHCMRVVDGGLVFWGVGENKKWLQQSTYGGRLVENMVQSVARDIMAEGMLNSGIVPVMTVHDEVVWEVQEAMGFVEGLEKAMNATPSWARGLPIASSLTVSRRYGKG